jgi:hypothetical protein
MTMAFEPAAAWGQGGFEARGGRDEERVRRDFWRKAARVAAGLPFAEDLLAAYYCAFDHATPLQVKAVLVGALNMGEYAYDFTGENVHYGASRNPHDVSRMTGGSSGGSGGAVAGGLVPIALGSDTNGSIRVPASLCGIFGLKPTYGRLSRAHTFPFVASLDHVGPLARSTRDLAHVGLGVVWERLTVVGGWQLGVSKFSKHKPAAIEFVRYMTSPAVQKFNAIYNSNVPTIPAVAKIKAVIKTNPYLTPAIANVARVTRPGKYLKTHYNEGSKAIYQGVSQILNGTPAKNVLPSIASKLNSLIK